MVLYRIPSVTKKIFISFLFFALVLFNDTKAQTHPGTGGTAPCGSCVPSGWTLVKGSPDISDATQWGYNGEPWATSIPPIPNGETTFMTAHSTEIGSMVIADLVAGNSYTLEFYYMTVLNSKPALGGYGGIVSPTIRYSMDEGNTIITRNIAQEATWYKEDVVFTATDVTATFTFYGGGHNGFFPGLGSTEGDLSNISFAPNSVVPSDPPVAPPVPQDPPVVACDDFSISVGASAIICEGESATLTAYGADSYTWFPGNATGNSIRVSPEKSTTYTVTGTSGNCSASEEIMVTILPLPVIIVSEDSICPGAMAKLTVIGGDSYVWSNGVAGDSILVFPEKTTTYSVKGFGEGCSKTVFGTVTVYPKPEADFTHAPDPIGKLNPVVSFEDKSSTDVIHWAWDFGDNDAVISDEVNPIHEYPATEAVYTVTLTVRNAGSCADTLIKEIKVGPEFSFFIPNAFTPNADGLNDGFGASGEGVITYNLRIFDRWGEQLFFTSDFNDRWMGDFMGKDCQEGVYVWQVELRDVFLEGHSYTGIVNLIK